ncbi:MAG: hypothetical protein M3275_15580 [Thermoproteota archaeon]|nr:hypothetical protein [Thermoproteota archaeon]
MDNLSKEDILYLGEKFSFHQLDLDDCPSKRQIPKIDALTVTPSSSSIF